MKSKIFYVVITMLFLMLIFLFVMLSMQKDDYHFKVTTIEKTNNYLVTKEDCEKNKDLIELIIYTSKKNVSITNINKITKVYLESDDMTISLKPQSIIDLNYKQSFFDEKFYMFSYLFKIDGINAEEYVINMEKAYLYLNTQNYNVKLLIGSFYYEKIEDIGNSVLSISKLKPIVNTINSNKTLIGLDIMFANYTKDEIKIKEIVALDASISFSHKESIIVTEDIQSNDNISKILGYYYDYEKKEEDEELNMILGAQSYVEMVIPVKYINNYPVYGCGLKIIFEFLETEYSLYFDDYNFFLDNTFVIDESKVRIDTYEDY